MPKYQHKPNIVEATQWHKDGDHAAVQPIHPAIAAAGGDVPGGFLNGSMPVSAGDYIVTLDTGEMYPVGKDAFEAMYEPVTPPKAAKKKRG